MQSVTGQETVTLISVEPVVRLTALMPCLNEERTLGICIEKAQACFAAMNIDGEIIVADNGSSDRSVEIATGLGARVVHVATKGYGAALTAGIEAARGEFIVMADSDDSYDWRNLQPFVRKLEEGFDLVVGNRFAGGIAPGAMPRLHRYFGNPVLSWLARTVHHAPIKDFHCGIRAMRRAAIPSMNLRTAGMEIATEMIVNSVQAGLRITEVPTRLNCDGRDRPPHLRSFRDGWRHLRFILTYGPNYLYLAPGGGCFLVGLAMVAVLAGGPRTVGGHYFGIHFMALACALTLVGFNVANFGILAKVVALRSQPQLRSRLARWAVLRFSLEAGLLTGSSLFLSGLAVDVWLLIIWLKAHGGPMEASVNAVFVATLAIVLGVNIALGSFLLHMLVADQRSRG